MGERERNLFFSGDLTGFRAFEKRNWAKQMMDMVGPFPTWMRKESECGFGSWALQTVSKC